MPVSKPLCPFQPSIDRTDKAKVRRKRQQDRLLSYLGAEVLESGRDPWIVRAIVDQKNSVGRFAQTSRQAVEQA